MSNKRIFHDPIHKEIVFDSAKPEELNPEIAND